MTKRKDPKDKQKVGRTPKFKDVTELVGKFNEYAEMCDKSKQLPEKAGLCLALGITRETWRIYKEKPDFHDAIKGIELYIESNWVRRLNSNAPTGAIFYLKNAFHDEYKDRHEVDATHKGGLTLTFDKTFEGLPEQKA